MLEEIGKRAARLANLANAERHHGQLDKIRGEAVALLLFIRAVRSQTKMAIGYEKTCECKPIPGDV